MPQTVKLKRDVEAIQVPFGTAQTLAKDTEVTITYSLGGNYTIIANDSMYRVDSKDADALGKTSVSPAIIGDKNRSLEDKAWAMLRTCYDPEIPVNIVDLGLIYGVDSVEIEDNPGKYKVNIRMTLTAPGCGMGPVIAEDAKQKVLLLPEVDNVTIEMVFDPPWDRSMMSDQAKLELGLF